MRKMKPWLKWVLVMLLLLFLVSFTASFDNVVSRKISEAIDKPGNWVRETAWGVALVFAGSLLLFTAVGVAVVPVLAVVLVVVGLALLGAGLVGLFGWPWGKSKPDNVTLNGAR